MRLWLKPCAEFVLRSIYSPCPDGYLAGNVRSVGIRLGVIEGEAEDCVS